MSASNDTPIAIIGMGCRLPGGVESPAGMWDLLVDGRDTAGRVPRSRWDEEALGAHHHPDLVDRAMIGCFLDGDVWAWDPETFSIAPNERDWVDPQVRVLMEVAWESVEYAGIPVDVLRGSRTGVYMGIFCPDNLIREALPAEDAPVPQYVFGSPFGGAAGRVAFAMDLRGPVMAIGTHCSSGMVAMDSACAALSLDECDTALAGATSLIIAPQVQLAEASFVLGKRGGCYSFDERADGYLRGEGAGVLVLKRLADARRDGDRVLAVIRGSGVNNDGQVTRATAPSTELQQELFREVVRRSEIDPGDVGMAEAHGTGTAVGDPVEYTSINAVYGRGRGQCALGSIKTNIGHTEPVAGIAGMIKATLCLQAEEIVPNRNFRRLHPSIPRDAESRLFVPTERTPWPVDGPRLAAVCSYGIQGTNGHAILERAPRTHRRRPSRSPAAPRSKTTRPHVFLLSGMSTEAVSLTAGRLAEWTGNAGASAPLPDIAHTLAVRRSHGPRRTGILAHTHAELAERAAAFACGAAEAGVVHGDVLAPPDHPGPVFVFSGQGSRWADTGRALLDTDDAFTAVIDELEPLISAEAGFSVRAMIAGEQRPTEIDQIQPVLFALQVALAAVWRSWGVTPGAVVGQSMGETAAAVVAGALSPEDGAAVICRRSRLLATASGGGMASVLLPGEQVERDIADAGADGVSIAVFTSPGSTVISGDAVQVARLVEKWVADGHTAQHIVAGVASHSPLMDPVLSPLAELLTGLRPMSPTIPFYSTVTDTAANSTSDLLDGGYWVSNLRRPVRFQQAISTALDNGHRLFVECTPHPLTIRAVAAIADDAGLRDVLAVGSLRRDSDDYETMLTNLIAVHCAGFDVDWATQADGELADVPATAWHRTRHGGDNEPFRLVAPGLVGASQHSLLGGYVHDVDQPGRHLWQSPISPARVPWLGDHQLADVPLLPGTGFAEMVLAAGQRIFDTDRVELTGLELLTPLLLEPEPTVTTRAVTDARGGEAEVTILSGGGDVDGDPQLHARATVRPIPAGQDAPRLDQELLPAEDWQDVVPGDFYQHLRDRHGLQHGPAFTALERIRVHPAADYAVSNLRIHDTARKSAWTFALHPALADELAQTAVSVWVDHHVLTPGPVVVAGFDAVRVHGPTGHASLCQARLHQADDMTVTASAVLATADGRVVAEVEGLRLANITPRDERYASRLFHLDWLPTPLPDSATDQLATGPWLVVGDHDDEWSQLVAQALRDRGASCELVSALPGHDLPDLLAGVVLTVSCDTDISDDDVVVAARDHVADTVGLIRALGTHPAAPRLWVLARREEATSLTAAGLRGLLRVAWYEYPTLTPSMIDLDPDTKLADVAAELLAGAPGPVEASYRQGTRFTARVRRGAPSASSDAKLPQPVCRGASYIVTGGLGGVGLRTAEWLAGRGAGHVVLCGRSAPSAHTEEVLASLRASGTAITVSLGDIGDPAVADRAVRHATRDGGQLRGVVHSAVALEDATLATLQPDQLARVWRGKAEGAWAMHRATLAHDLDFWVVYSSMAALFGSPGQGAYAAANHWIEELVAWRADHELPATSIQWGGWLEIGGGQGFAAKGYAMIKPSDGIDALERILTAGHVNVAYSALELNWWTGHYPHVARSTLFSDLLAPTDDQQRSTVLDDLLAAATEGQRRAILEDHIIDCIRDVLGGTNRRITRTTSMVILGIDSLGAVQVQNRLQRSLKIVLDLGVIWVNPTADSLADWILRRMGFGGSEGSEPASAPEEMTTAVT